MQEREYNMEPLNVLLLFFMIVILWGVISCFFIVEQQTCALVERFGRFVRIAQPGLHFKIPLIERISGVVSLRLMQLNVEIETKTLDDVFIKILTSVQFCIIPNKVYEAFYTLDNAERQIQAYVFDVVRARVPSIKLDDVFAKKDDIANAVRGELQEVMNAFGYNIIKALVTDINPDSKVKAAMNEINEAQRLRIAASERGEAEKIIRIKAAEAEAESKILQGKGMAGQRSAIIEGLHDSLQSFKEVIKDTNTQDVMSLILMTQYFDTLKELGNHSNLNTILLPYSPSTQHDFYQQIRDAMITGNLITDKHTETDPHK